MGRINNDHGRGEPASAGVGPGEVRLPSPTAEVAATLIDRLKGDGCTAAYAAERIGCNNREATAWIRAQGAIQRSRTHTTVWGMPDAARARASVLRQSQIGSFSRMTVHDPNPRDWNP